MSAKNIKKVFVDKQVEEFSGGENSPELLIRHKTVLDLILKFSSPGEDIVDVGCFDGKILKELKKYGYRNLYGTDFTKTSQKSFKGTGINYVASDIEADPLPFTKKFDVIIVTDVLEHLFNPEEILARFKTRLRTGGRIIFSVPNAGWFLNGFLLTFLPGKLFLSTAFGPWGHTHQFTFYEIRKISENLKLRIEVLSGTRMDNYVFKSGLKKVIYDVFLLFLYPLSIKWPEIFADHIFGVLVKG